jgi:hypothetical protein
MAVDVIRTLRAALSRLESERARLDRQIAALRTALGTTSDGRAAGGRRRRMSAAARRAVSLRMKAYWSARRRAKAARGRKAEKGAGK